MVGLNRTIGRPGEAWKTPSGRGRMEAMEYVFPLRVGRSISAISETMKKQFSLIFQCFCLDLISFGRRGIMNLVFPGRTGEYDQL